MTSKAQNAEQKDTTKSRFEIMLLGNRSIVSGIYGRTISNSKTTTLMANAGIGIVPGSHDQDTIPSYLQLGIGPSAEFGAGPNKFVLGITYSLIIKLGQDKKNVETGKYTHGLLLDIGYARHFKKAELILKILFTPILLGDDYRKITNIPFGFSFGGTF